MPQRDTARVLVVDDDLDTRDMLHELLEDEGYIVTDAPDGAAALAVLRTTAHRLVVLVDHLMPGLSGRQVLEAIQRYGHLTTRHAYILMTASANPDTPPPLLTAGMTVPVVAKPFELEQLLTLVAQAARQIENN